MLKRTEGIMQSGWLRREMHKKSFSSTNRGSICGRAPRGQRCLRVVGARTSPNFTLAIAVSNSRGLVHSETVEGGFNSERFNLFLRDASQAAGIERATFVFDNAPSRRRAHEVHLF